MKTTHQLTLLAIISLFLISGCAQPQQPIDQEMMANDAMDDDNMDNNMMDDEATNTPSTGSTKTFTLTGENFKFVMDGQDNPTLRVNQGDTVRIEFTSTDGFHDWVLDEFNAATPRVTSGQADASTTTVEFVADKKGTFEYYCSVGSHRSRGMAGTFIVE